MLEEFLKEEKEITKQVEKLLQRYSMIGDTTEEVNSLLADIYDFFVFLDGVEAGLESFIDKIKKEISKLATQHLDFAKINNILLQATKRQERFYGSYNFISCVFKGIEISLKTQQRNDSDFLVNVKTFTVPKSCSC